MRLSSGGEVETSFVGDPPVPGSPWYYNPYVIGGSDLNADGHREVFVQVAHGASTGVDSVFRLLNHHLAQLNEAGQPATLYVAGSVMHLDGFYCHPPVLVSWGATATADGKTYRQTVARYRISAADLVLLSTRHRRVSAARVQGDIFSRCVGLPGAN